MNEPIERTLSELLPHVTLHMAPTEIVLDAVILLRVVDTEDDGRPRLHLQTTPELDWMLQIGMLTTAADISRGTTTLTDEERD